MIAVDTNLLVYAHRSDSPWHQPARARIASLAEGTATWAIPWPCVHEFLGIVTHPRIYSPATPIPIAIETVSEWLRAPALVLIGEAPGYWERLATLVLRGRVAGAAVHDARIAAICLLHGVGELWSADRDFTRFPELTIRNPLVEDER